MERDPLIADALIAADVAAVGRIDAVPKILQVVAHTTGMRFVAIARVTDDSWTACSVYDQIDFGLKPGGQLVLESTICNEIRQHHQPVVFVHASADARFCEHPTPKLYGIESYISIPILLADGSFFGTLCAIDPLPRKLDDPHIVTTLELFAQLIGSQLEMQDRLIRTGSELVAALDVAKLREQFIAVLGHDLRDPLCAVLMGAKLLQMGELEASARRTVGRIEQSSQRMSALIDDVLDFARGRLGGGIPVSLRTDEDITDELEQVVAELRMANPGRRIDVSLSIRQLVNCDSRRIAQLFGNLLGNALRHGAEDQPIVVEGCVVEGCSDNAVFELSVANGGKPIPDEKRARLFQPFSRSVSSEPGPGLGLGLYIAAEIARAHHGTLHMESSDARTRFVFRMPTR